MFSFASCEGALSRRSEALETLRRYIEDDWSLFAAADRGPTGGGLGSRYQVILEGGSDEFVPAIVLNFSESGLRWLWEGCDPSGPVSMLQPGYAPDFLISPPSAG